MSTLQKGNKVDINDAHTVLGHIGKALLEKTAKEIGWELIGTLRTCDACAKAKAVATRVPKTASEKATKPGERLFVDTSGPYPTSLGGSEYWFLAVDDFTRYKISGFAKKKCTNCRALNEVCPLR